jgi:hypothetical protein
MMSLTTRIDLHTYYDIDDHLFDINDYEYQQDRYYEETLNADAE